ncbi:MAG: hypothetical protein ACE5G0_21550, partial [Rhodothermales bacterium]
IASYLYPDPETKARLTGARNTNVAPVWLRRPQVHVLLTTYDRVFAHELAHVFSRSFGLPVLKASLAVGLVEGFAVALEPPDGLPTPHEQVAVAMQSGFRADQGLDSTLAGVLVSRLSPLGFWTGRGAVSYTMMGSFVRYLLDAYGAERLKRVYATAHFEEVYGKPVRVLAQEWQAYVQGLPFIDRSAGELVARRFSIPSLFEKRCPHYVPVYLRFYRRGRQALAAGDTAQARRLIETSLQQQPVFDRTLAAWASLRLAAGASAEVIARLDTLSPERMTPSLAVRLGDAWALEGRVEEAQSRFDTALMRLPGYAHEQRALILLRKSLAGHSAILRIITSGWPDEEQAGRLVAFRDSIPAAGVAEALLWGRAGHHEYALDRLIGTPPVDGAQESEMQRNTLHRQRLVWLARQYYGAGRPDSAAFYAEEAARRARDMGDLNGAAFLRDFVVKMHWVRQEGRYSDSSSGP